MTDAQQPQPLWTDENIMNDARRATSNPTAQAQIRSCLLFMRHGYEAERQQLTARIQELERELAEARSQRWDPVEDGEYVHDSIIDGRIVVRVEDNGKTVQINDTDGYGTECIRLDGTEYRLCRLAPHAQHNAAPDAGE